MLPSSEPTAANLSLNGLYPLIGLSLAAFLVSIALLLSTGEEQDRAAAERSVAFERAAIAHREEHLATSLADYAAWGEAYVHLHAAFDKDWAFDQGNLAATMFERFGITHVFVLGPDDATRYALIDGRLSDKSAAAIVSGGLEKIVAHARALGVGDASEAASGVVVIDDAPTLVAAAAISTGGASVAKVAGPASIMVFAHRLSPPDLKALGETRFVDGLHVAAPGEDRADGAADVLRVEDGSRTFDLRWTPDRPGGRFVGAIMPWMLIALSAMLVLGGLILRRARASAGLVASSATQLTAAYRAAERQALHDATTGLPNRTMLAQHVKTALQAGRSRLVVLFLDLDRFKPINDAHGHAAGDQVLQAVADRLRVRVGERGVVARVGGDEFVVVLDDTPRDRLDRLCGQLIEDVSSPIRHDSGEAWIGLSIGVALSEPGEDDMEELLRRADLALYRAKEDGRGVHRFYDAAMNERIARRRQLESEMWRALERGEFSLDYQPRYDTRTLKMRRVEALLRWRHPERGLISPSEFVPLAEETGLILPIGDWVMRTACAQAAQWPDIGVSVNCSGVQVRQGGLAAAVASALAESGLAPDRLEIELTEGVLLENVERAQAMLMELKGLGVRLAMDDFGTGYSSLGYIRNFPFDAIKIDRSFIADLDVDSDGRAIIQTILGLGRALGLTVTAEGVETREQLLLLQLDRCEEVQGFYLSRPLPPEEIAMLLAAAAKSEPGPRSIFPGRSAG